MMAKASRAAEERARYGDDDELEPRNASDQVVHLQNVTWEMYEQLDASRGESANPRLTYDDGELELMSPGTDHEFDKKTLARLFEAYCEHLEVPVQGFGSWTVKKKKKKGGAEADECYVLSDREIDRAKLAHPDLVLEVMYHTTSNRKLAVWRRLGAREVWFWRAHRLEIFVLEGTTFVPAQRSKLIPAIDPALLVRCMDQRTQLEALRLLRATLAKKR